MTTLYVLIWIGYAFYWISKGTNENEVFGQLVSGLLYGLAWPILIPIEIYSALKGGGD